MNVTEAVTSRRSVRMFTDQPVDLETIRRVLDTARWAASGCNYQPWEAAVVTGESLKELQAKITTTPPQEAEYDWTAPGQEDAYKQRLNAVSKGMFGSMGIARDDGEGRMKAMMRNSTSFDAPCVMFTYFPRLMKEAQWSDTGMWLQTVALLLREEGLDSCFQEYMALYANVIRDHLGLDHERYMLFCGMAIGYRDPEAPLNNFERERVPLDEHVSFPGLSKTDGPHRSANEDELTPEQKQGFAMAEAFMGFLPSSSVSMAHWPELSATFGPFAANILAGGELSQSLKNMIELWQAARPGAVIAWRTPPIRRTVLEGDAEKIAKVWEYQNSDLFTDAERAALDLALAGGQVPNGATDAHFDELKKHYTNKQIVEIVAVIALFGFLNRYNDTIGSALEAEPLGFAKETFAQRDWDG